MRLNEQEFNDAIKYLEEGLFNKFRKKQKVNQTPIESKPQIQYNIIPIRLGFLGNFSKIDTGYSENPNICAYWKPIIESHSTFIINHFLVKGILEWFFDCEPDELKKYIKPGQNIENMEADIKKELSIYLNKNSKKSIAELFKKYLPRFNINAVLQNISLDGLSLDDDNFSIQMSDNKFLVSAYDRFKADLTPCDWHNF